MDRLSALWQRIRTWLIKPVLSDRLGLLLIIALAGTILGGWSAFDRRLNQKFFDLPRIQKDLVDLILHSPNRYIVRRGETISSLTDKFFHRVDYLTRQKFQKEIIKENNLADPALEPGQVMIIPRLDYYYHQPNQQLGWPADKPKMGIYLAWTLVADPSLDEILDQLLASGGNAVVFDIKDVDGYLRYRTQVPLAKETGAGKYALIADINKFIYCLHQKGIYVIARQALFADNLLAGARPDMAIDARNGGIWIDKPWFKWVDPGKASVQEYNLALAREAMAHGVDEVQFDYCRFPTEGNLAAADFAAARQGLTKYQVIEGFLQKARAMADEAGGVPLGVDLFGIVSWQRDIDINRTGQRVPEISKCVDTIYPMLYPSHFNDNFDGKTNPADHPVYFINRGTEKFIQLSAGNLAKIIPWLQGFSLRVTDFGPDYIFQQMKAAVDAGSNGFMVWNAAGDYSQTWPALKKWTDEQKARVEKSTP